MVISTGNAQMNIQVSFPASHCLPASVFLSFCPSEGVEMSDASELSHVTPSISDATRSSPQPITGNARQRPEAQIIALCLTCCCEKRTAVDQFTALLLLLFFYYWAIEAAPLVGIHTGSLFISSWTHLLKSSPSSYLRSPASFPTHHGRSRSGIIEPRAAGVLTGAALTRVPYLSLNIYTTQSGCNPCHEQQ